MTRILYRHSDWIPNKAATKYSINNIYIKIEKSGDETDLCYPKYEIGSYKEDADWRRVLRGKTTSIDQRAMRNDGPQAEGGRNNRT